MRQIILWINVAIKRGAPLLLLLSAALAPSLASAHEVYVLSHDSIEQALQQPPLQAFSIIYAESGRFFFWMFLTVSILLFVWIVSLSKRLEGICDPFLLRLKRYAPFVGRLTLGTAVIASAYYGAMFGPELPFSLFLPAAAIDPFRIFLYVLGAFLVVGFLTRLSAFLLMLAYVAMYAHFYSYMLTYLNYFGEMVISLTLGSEVLAVDALLPGQVPAIFRKAVDFVREHAYVILRIAFGTSLIYASVYAKFLHAQLALDTVVQYRLTDYFHFDPQFLVLGAFAIELLLGTLFILGVELRFAAVFLIVFLTLSLIYFGEAVWPHIILAGGALTIFFQGYGRFTLERQFLIHRHREGEEPVF